MFTRNHGLDEHSHEILAGAFHFVYGFGDFPEYDIHDFIAIAI